MSAHGVKIGIDLRGGLYYAARIEEGAGRPDIKALARFERAHLADHELLKGGRVVMSVPDNRIVIKRIGLPENESDPAAKAKFELSQMLLEDEKEFLFDLIDTGRNNQYLGLIVRREQIDACFSRYSGELFTTSDNTDYRMRAAALAKGYLTFCRPVGGDLVCLADFNDESVSIVFVFRGRTIGFTHASLENLDLSVESDLQKMAIDFKTVINFALASLFEQGVTTPLSALVVSSDGPNGEITSALKTYFSIEIATAEINPGFLAERGDVAAIPMEKYLVALGLTIN